MVPRLSRTSSRLLLRSAKPTEKDCIARKVVSILCKVKSRLLSTSSMMIQLMLPRARKSHKLLNNTSRYSEVVTAPPLEVASLTLLRQTISNSLRTIRTQSKFTTWLLEMWFTRLSPSFLLMLPKRRTTYS